MLNIIIVSTFSACVVLVYLVGWWIHDNVQITASRWPWQPDYGWGCKSGWKRFGGGWSYKLGIDIGGSTVILNLIFGMVRIYFGKRSG